MSLPRYRDNLQGKRRFALAGTLRAAVASICELITHIKKFKGTKTLGEGFLDDCGIQGDRMGCFLLQLPPSYRYSHRYSASSTLPAVTSSSFVTRVGGTRRSTPSFARPVRSSALAAARDRRASWSGQPTISTFVCMALSWSFIRSASARTAGPADARNDAVQNTGNEDRSVLERLAIGARTCVADSQRREIATKARGVTSGVAVMSIVRPRRNY